MKIRIGFVSNSSSSSFICLGTTNTNTINALLQSYGVDSELLNSDNWQKFYDIAAEVGFEYWGGILYGHDLVFVDDGGKEFSIGGFGDKKLTTMLKKHGTDALTKKFVAFVKKQTGKDINPAEVYFEFGEASSG